MQQARDQGLIGKPLLKRTLLDRFQILGRNPNVQPAILSECGLGVAKYLPPATNLTDHSQAHLDAIAVRLNTRPRMTLGYQTPAAKLAEIVAATG